MNLRHPYLYFSKEDIPKLRSLSGQTPHATIWKNILLTAENHLADPLPTQPPPGPGQPFLDDGTTFNPEFLVIHNAYYENGYRVKYYGEMFAFAYLVSGDRRFLRRAKEWVLNHCSWSQWDETANRGDVQSSHALCGIAIVYDWLYEDLTPDERETIRRALVENCKLFHENWSKSFDLGNHYWVCYAALGCKINGSGGGGCMFAYAPRRERDVAAAIESVGGKAYIVNVCGGVQIQSGEDST
jgi:hypothetical protein